MAECLGVSADGACPDTRGTGGCVISSWDTSLVTDMFNSESSPCYVPPPTHPTRVTPPVPALEMPAAHGALAAFKDAAAFNQDISSWNTAKVTTMLNSESSPCPVPPPTQPA